MNIARVHSFAFSGIEAILIEVQVQITSGLPSFIIVGLPDKAVGEARERVRAALISMGLVLPAKRIVVNLSPANLLKEGSHFDLPIAIAVLGAMAILPVEEMLNYAALGELSLDGYLTPVSGVLPSSIAANQHQLGLICPFQQAKEANWAGNIKILAPEKILDLVNHFKGTQLLDVQENGEIEEKEPYLNLSDIRGLSSAKRALEVAAAGMHNLLMIGPPGTGKSMLAARLPGLLPELTPQEALEVSIIHSIAGQLTEGKLRKYPPFRAPHHSASQAALVGGGQKSRPGEVSLAHCGILFLDEVPEFSRSALEALRTPMETGFITIARALAHIKYPAHFQFIGAMNPCRCGYLGIKERECPKAPHCGFDYRARLSGPFLDRIDIFIEMQAVETKEILYKKAQTYETEKMAENILKAREFAQNRALDSKEISDSSFIEKFKLHQDSIQLLEKAALKFGLSSRGVTRVIKVSRTIADLAKETYILKEHMAEALTYRNRFALSHA